MFVVYVSQRKLRVPFLYVCIYVNISHARMKAMFKIMYPQLTSDFSRVGLCMLNYI
jgi:hypothetical protein